MICILIIYTILNYLIWIFLAVIQIYPGWHKKNGTTNKVELDETTFWKITDIIQRKVLYYIDVIIQAIVIFLQVLLFIILVRTMKYKLHFYYMNLKVKLYILFILSFIVLIFHTVYYSFSSHIYFDFEFRTVLYIGKFPYK